MSITREPIPLWLFRKLLGRFRRPWQWLEAKSDRARIVSLFAVPIVAGGGLLWASINRGDFFSNQSILRWTNLGLLFGAILLLTTTDPPKAKSGDSPEAWLRSANTYFLLAVVCWLGFYASRILGDHLTSAGVEGADSDLRKFLINVIPTVFSLANTGFLYIAYCYLSLGSGLRRMGTKIVCLLLILAVILSLAILGNFLGPSSEPGSAEQGPTAYLSQVMYPLLAGIMGAIVLALFARRLASRNLMIADLAIAFLFLYSAIQPLYPRLVSSSYHSAGAPGFGSALLAVIEERSRASGTSPGDGDHDLNPAATRELKALLAGVGELVAMERTGKGAALRQSAREILDVQLAEEHRTATAAELTLISLLEEERLIERYMRWIRFALVSLAGCLKVLLIILFAWAVETRWLLVAFDPKAKSWSKVQDLIYQFRGVLRDRSWERLPEEVRLAAEAEAQSERGQPASLQGQKRGKRRKKQ